MAVGDSGGREPLPGRRLPSSTIARGDILLPDEPGELHSVAALLDWAEYRVGYLFRRVRVVPDAQMVLAEQESSLLVLLPEEVVAAHPLHLRGRGRSPPGMSVQSIPAGFRVVRPDQRVDLVGDRHEL